MMVVAFVDFFAADELPTKFWLFFVALPFFAVGGWMMQAGYAGVAARYAAGEFSPVAKDAASYLTDGEGLLGVGRTIDDRGQRAASDVAAGPYCRSCGARNDADARFCDGCGQSLA